MKKPVLTAVTTLVTTLLLAAPAFAQTAPTPAASTPATAPAAAGSKTPAKPATMPATTPVPATPVNVNTASAAQLATIPGISTKIAVDVIKNRPYKNSADLVKKVKGIGSHNIKKMLPYITF